MNPQEPLLRPRIFRPTPINLKRLASKLKRGEIVGVPSETVYGLAADALNPAACLKIFAAKKRPTTDPLIVHLESIRDLDKVAHVNETALTLAEAFWPGPLTLVLPKKEVVPLIVTAGRQTVAVRVPDHPLFRKLILLSQCPLAAPSANPFGYISPTSAVHVRDSLTGSGLTAILDGGNCVVGVESTIVDLSNPSRPRLLRPGGIDVEKIEMVLHRKLSRPSQKNIDASKSAPAPGMLSRHYSPRTKLILHTTLDPQDVVNMTVNEVCLLLSKPSAEVINSLKPNDRKRLRWLSERGRLHDIAKNLFSILRIIDGEGWSSIHTCLVPGYDGLAPAINDRLSRASAKS
ncbi:MAG: hypothetical protein RIQ79_1955 [Verrucomicrobiota bacterium]|jgi:L-threonylcarbamoyladenylate synthase